MTENHPAGDTGGPGLSAAERRARVAYQCDEPGCHDWGSVVVDGVFQPCPACRRQAWIEWNEARAG
jgi:hypothetical protein